MIRYIRYLILAVFLVVLVLIALANRAVVSLSLLPEGLPFAAETTRAVPLFVVIFAAIAIGLLLGYFLEFFREHKYRKKAAVKNREAAALTAEFNQIRKSNGSDEDDVLALLK